MQICWSTSPWVMRATWSLPAADHTETAIIDSRSIPLLQSSCSKADGNLCDVFLYYLYYMIQLTQFIFSLVLSLNKAHQSLLLNFGPYHGPNPRLCRPTHKSSHAHSRTQKKVWQQVTREKHFGFSSQVIDHQDWETSMAAASTGG